MHENGGEGGVEWDEHDKCSREQRFSSSKIDKPTQSEYIHISSSSFFPKILTVGNDVYRSEMIANTFLYLHIFVGENFVNCLDHIPFSLRPFWIVYSQDKFTNPARPHCVLNNKIDCIVLFSPGYQISQTNYLIWAFLYFSLDNNAPN